MIIDRSVRGGWTVYKAAGRGRAAQPDRPLRQPTALVVCWCLHNLHLFPSALHVPCSHTPKLPVHHPIRQLSRRAQVSTLQYTPYAPTPPDKRADELCFCFRACTRFAIEHIKAPAIIICLATYIYAYVLGFRSEKRGLQLVGLSIENVVCTSKKSDYFFSTYIASGIGRVADTAILQLAERRNSIPHPLILPSRDWSLHSFSPKDQSEEGFIFLFVSQR